MKRVFACAAVLLLLGGCRTVPFARELEATMLVQVLGIDAAEGKITLTAACDPETGSGRSDTAVLSASGATLGEAMLLLKAAGDEYVSLTHVTQIILGSGTEPVPILKEVLNDPVLGQGATVWLAGNTTAETLMEAVGGGARRLSSIELNSAAEPVSVLQCLMRLNERGRVMVPVLEIGEGRLVWTGERTVRGC